MLGNVEREPLRDIITRFRSTLVFRVIAAYGAVGLQLLLQSRGVAGEIDTDNFIHVCHLCRALNSSSEFHSEFELRTGIDLLGPKTDAEFAVIEAQIDDAFAVLFRTGVDRHQPAARGG